MTGKTDSRYSTEGLVEARFEPGSRNRVLRNLLGIRRKREMDRLEARELLRAMEEVAGQFDRDHRSPLATYVTCTTCGWVGSTSGPAGIAA